MSRVRLTRTTIVEYELHPEWYPAGWTAKQMVEHDASVDARDEVFSSNIVSDEVAYEMLKDGDKK